MFARIVGQDFFKCRASDWSEPINCRSNVLCHVAFRKKLSEKSFSFRGLLHLRQPILAALLGRFDRDLLPFGLLLRGALRIDMHNGAIGKNRRDLGRADLDRFLHDQVHVLPFRESPGRA